MTYLRMDKDTGAKFAGDRIADDLAVVSLMTTPRSEGQEARTDLTVSFFREWLSQLPAAVSRITAWASTLHESDFLRSIGFSDEAGYVSPEGGRGMILHRTA